MPKTSSTAAAGSSQITPQQTVWVIRVLLVIVTALVFAQIRNQIFVGVDDALNVYKNHFLNPVTPEHVLRFWQKPYFGLYVPLTYTIWAGLALIAHLPSPIQNLDGDTLQLSATTFHVANLFVHLCNVLLVFSLLRKLLPESDRVGMRDWAAGAGALLFGIHPMQVETVCWVSEMRGLLSAFFSLLALRSYVSFAQSNFSKGRMDWPKFIWATIAFVCALLCKPSAAAMPFVAWAVHVWLLRPVLDKTSTSLNRYWPLLIWVGITAIFIPLTRSAQPVSPLVILPMWQRFFVAGDALAFYLGKLVCPFSSASFPFPNYAMDYGRRPDDLMRHSWAYATWIVPGILAALLWWRRRQAPTLLGAGLIFVCGVLPVLGLIPFVFQEYSTVADRYMYPAFLAPALAMAWLILQVRRPAWFGLLGVVYLMFGFLTNIQVEFWNNSYSLFNHTRSVNPRSWMIQENVCNIAHNLSLAGRFDEAVTQYKIALNINPNLERAHYDLGVVYAETGHTDDAIAEFKNALMIKPKSINSLVNLANAFATQGNLTEAIATYRRALEIDPNDAQIHNNLGLALVRAKNIAEAIQEYQKAIALKPDYAKAHYNLGNVLVSTGKNTEAAAEFRAALKIVPDYEKAKTALEALPKGL